jgi:hypothetical protein
MHSRMSAKGHKRTSILFVMDSFLPSQVAKPFRPRPQAPPFLGTQQQWLSGDVARFRIFRDGELYPHRSVQIPVILRGGTTMPASESGRPFF